LQLFKRPVVRLVILPHTSNKEGDGEADTDRSQVVEQKMASQSVPWRNLCFSMLHYLAAVTSGSASPFQK